MGLASQIAEREDSVLCSDVRGKPIATDRCIQAYKKIPIRKLSHPTIRKPHRKSLNLPVDSKDF